MTNITEMVEKLEEAKVCLMGVEHMVREIIEVSPLPHKTEDVKLQGGYAIIAIKTLAQVEDTIEAVATDLQEAESPMPEVKEYA